MISLKSKIPNYPSYASVYTLIEETNSSEFNNPDIIIQNKETLVEHIAKQSSTNKPKKRPINRRIFSST
jgi:hypothetical protein